MPDLNNVLRYIAAGFQRFDFHQTDSRGLPAGPTGVVVAGATGVAAGRITAAKTMNINIPAATAEPVTGDNVLQGSFMFPDVAPRLFDFEFAEDDFADRRAFQNILARNIGNVTFAGRDVAPFVLNNIMFIGLSNAKAQASGIKGLPLYAGVFSTRAEMSVRGRSTFAERAAASYLASINLNGMDSYPWGETFQVGTGHEGYTQSFIEDWTFKYPPSIHRWTQSSGVTVFNLGETPASTSLDDNLIYVIDSNGIPTRKTSGVTIDTVAKTVTFAVAPPDGYDIVDYYGYVPS